MRKIDHELPWGCWLRLEAEAFSPPVYVDNETGKEWSSVREAFWVGRLRGELRGAHVPSHRLEQLHAILAGLLRRSIRGREGAGELFGGNDAFAEWYLDWLRVEGLATLEPNGTASLTAEGHAALLMLVATRPQRVAARRPDAATVRQLSELGLGPEERDARLARLEKAAEGWEVAFLRRSIAAKPMIVLSIRGEGPMPVMQSVWTTQFDTEGQRDGFYDWLGLRLDRWPAWGVIVATYGAAELTHRMLVSMAASLEDGPSKAPQVALAPSE